MLILKLLTPTSNLPLNFETHTNLGDTFKYKLRVQIKTTTNKGDVFMIGSFGGGEFRQEFYKKRGWCYEFLTLEGTNNEDGFILSKVTIKLALYILYTNLAPSGIIKHTER